MGPLFRSINFSIAIFFFTAACRSSPVAHLPQRPSGPVADFANVIDNDIELKINTLARNLWIDAGFGLLLVTLDSTGTLSPDSFMTALCREWRVWTKEKPQGLVLLLTRAPPAVHLMVGDGSTEYLTPEVCATLKKSIDMSARGLPTVSGQSLHTVTSLAELVVRRDTPLPSGMPRYSGQPTTDTSGSIRKLQTMQTGIVAATVILLLLAVMLLRRLSYKKTPHATPKEPFGNTLSGDGFGGRLLRRER